MSASYSSVVGVAQKLSEIEAKGESLMDHTDLLVSLSNDCQEVFVNNKHMTSERVALVDCISSQELTEDVADLIKSRVAEYFFDCHGDERMTNRCLDLFECYMESGTTVLADGTEFAPYHTFSSMKEVDLRDAMLRMESALQNMAKGIF